MDFRVNIEPTPELCEITVNGVKVPLRIWRGLAMPGSVPVEMYVLSIVPASPAYHDALAAELPLFMRPTRDTVDIDIDVSTDND